MQFPPALARQAACSIHSLQLVPTVGVSRVDTPHPVLEDRQHLVFNCERVGTLQSRAIGINHRNWGHIELVIVRGPIASELNATAQGRTQNGPGILAVAVTRQTGSTRAIQLHNTLRASPSRARSRTIATARPGEALISLTGSCCPHAFASSTLRPPRDTYLKEYSAVLVLNASPSAIAPASPT